jgi:lambda repressor-like predicted transcriptional regulator
VTINSGISALSTQSMSAQSMQALAAASRRPEKSGGGPIAVAAKALGLSTDDVISQLKDGKSLGDIADAQGVSRDDLATALKNGMPDGAAASPNADEVVNNIINRVGMPQRHHGTPPADDTSTSSGDSTASGVLGSSLTSSQESTLNALSSLLGTDSSSLMDSLKAGTSLSDLVSAAGVDQSSLASILQDGLMFDGTA